MQVLLCPHPQDDALAQMRSMGVQLREVEEERDRIEARLATLQRSLGDAEEGRRDIDSRLASAQTALMLQEETIRRSDRERKAMSDKIAALERAVAGLETEKRQHQVLVLRLLRLRKLPCNHIKYEQNSKF